jgi:serine protease Do
MGIVSAKSRSIGAGPYDDFIQTDASINPGNSGGPLFDLHGQVVGINTAIARQGRGIGFAIPIDEVKTAFPQLISTGHIARGHLGLAVQAVDAKMSRALGIDRPRGALVADVEKGGPADKAGLRSGDVILSVDNVDVAHAQDLARIIAGYAPGTKVALKIVRNKGALTVDVKLDALKDEETASEPRNHGSENEPNAGAATTPELGADLQDAPGASGVIVRRVVPGSPADGALERGDVITEIDHSPVQSARQLDHLIRSAAPGAPWLFKVQREGHTHYVAVERK